MAADLSADLERVRIAVFVHRLIASENALKAAQAEVAAVRSAAHAAGLAPRHIKAAMAALKRRQAGGLAPVVQAIVDAVEAVPIGDVEVLHGSALSPVCPRRPLCSRK